MDWRANGWITPGPDIELAIGFQSTAGAVMGALNKDEQPLAFVVRILLLWRRGNNLPLVTEATLILLIAVVNLKPYLLRAQSIYF
jgi:hypothetical protein